MSAVARCHLVVWYWLMALVLASVAATAWLPKQQALTLIFAVAVIKALLIARNYMHLKREKALIYALVVIPLVFVLIFLFGLFPDFVYPTGKH